MKRRQLLLAAVATSSAMHTPSWSQASGWPNRPLRIVVGFPPGGSADTMARALANSLQKTLGQSVVVENKQGASSIIAAEYVIRSTDGHTLFLHPAGIHALRPHVTKLRFDPWKSLLMISTVATVPNVFVTSAKKPFKSLADVVSYSKTSSQQLNMAMAGNATQTHLTSELFRRDAQLSAVAVPFNGAPPALQALLAGDVDIVNVDANTVVNQIKSGQLTGLAVAARQRYQFLPDVPTTSEAGFPEVLGSNSYGIHAPAAMEPAHQKILLAGVHAALKDPVLETVFKNAGLTPQGSTPAEFTAMAREDEARYAPLIKALGLKME
ncbi:MAG: tripartite tricarboxylate transporter substrate binding protein [Comamonadaceae bacterium]|nr:tripartite tricarboxylate transporter substrate binding protein [Comamonadaceae bacterium]